MANPVRILPLNAPPQPRKRERKRAPKGPGVFRRAATWLQRIPPPMIDVGMALTGTVLVSVGLGLIYLPAGIVAAGLGLFYLGAWHR